MLLENGAWSDRVEFSKTMKKSDSKYKWLEVLACSNIKINLLTVSLIYLLTGVRLYHEILRS